MSSYNKKDFYHQKAKEEGFVARSAYKLQELQKKFHLIKPGAKVLDLGCAPGAWVQVALPLVKDGLVVGIDIEKVEWTHPQFRFLHRDIFLMDPTELTEAPFDVVLSDMAPKTSGIKIRDHALSVDLCLRAIEFSEKFLKPGGSMVLKLFEGEDSKKIKTRLEAIFAQAKTFRPQSTRQASIEVYWVALSKKKLLKSIT